MLREKVYHYFIEKNFNCAETLIWAANDEYKLGLNSESIKLIGGFGGGMGCGNTCGALAGSVAAIGKILVGSTMPDAPSVRDTCAKLVENFEAKLGSTMCDELVKKYKRDDGTRCLMTVELAADVLDELVSSLWSCEAVTAEQKAAVKGEGFLFDKNSRNRFNARVITTNGKITTAQARAIAEAADKFGSGEFAMTSRQAIEIQGVAYDDIKTLQAFLAEYDLETGGTGPKVRPVVSCKGTTCQYGNIDTFTLSREIHHRFYKGYRSVKLPHKFKIAVGGCPNNCVKPDTNDLGIVGVNIPKIDLDKCRGCKKCQIVSSCPVKSAELVDGKISVGTACNSCGRCVGSVCPFGAVTEATQGYRVYIGGRWGKKTAKGKPLSKICTDKNEALAIVEKCILFFRESGIAGERFEETITRVGFETANAIITGDEILSRKEEILAK